MNDLRRILIDTSAWIALLNSRDSRHSEAVRFLQELPPSARRLTTWGIVSETYTWLRYHIAFAPAERWLHEEAALQHRGVLEIVFPTSADDEGVRRNLSRFSDQDLSYVDAFSLHTLQTRRNIDGVFAFDHHLSLTGTPVFPDTSSRHG